MSELSDKDIDRIADAIAPRLIEQVQKTHHEFWIDPQEHYDAHAALDGLLKDYSTARGIFMKVFLSAVAIASILAAAWAVIPGNTHKP